MSIRFQTLKTPNPNERKFLVSVDDRRITPSTIPQVGVTYDAWTLPAKERLDKGWEDYVYLEPMDTGTQGLSGFLFGKNHTEEEKAVPFNKYTTYESYTWPAVLSAFGILLDSTAPIQFFSDSDFSTLEKRKRPFVRAYYQPEVRIDSEVIVEEFLSTTPYSSAQLYHQQPVPSEVAWDVLGSQGSFQKCLHPEIEFAEIQSMAQVLGNMGTKNASRYFGNSKPQRFPGTNMTTWQSFVLSDEQTKVEGQYLRIRRTIMPPKGVTFITSAA